MFNKLVIFAVCAVLLNEGAPVVEPTNVKQEDPFFLEYLNRKLVFVEADPNFAVMCFRSTFRVRELSDYVYGRPTLEQYEMMRNWIGQHFQHDVLKRVEERLVENKVHCNSPLVDYMLQHRLPENWEKGTEMNYLDFYIILYRRTFGMNFPRSCRNPEKVEEHIIYSHLGIQILDYKMMKKHDPTDEDQFEVTVLTCTPITKF